MADLFMRYPDYDNKPVRQLLELVWNQREPLSRRASAVASLGRRSATDPAAVEALESIATDGMMRETRMFHLTSLAYLAVAGLVNGGTEQSVGAVRRALAEFDDADRKASSIFCAPAGYQFRKLIGTWRGVRSPRRPPQLLVSSSAPVP